ncbi:hypothetical protein [Butyrivibrio sp. AE2015]|uniref:hypothetical protein n=1 Tax=Butyrivibrio sp. AE2015 TaxID=1280663 RepID=UPI0003B5A70F|nr:hypothetical protein [Butyrivibrio sp. AE2015]
MLKNIRSYFYNLKKYQLPLERYFFPVVLLLYPLIGVNQGLDISDTMYSLTNYEYIETLNPMWLFSTYLSNVFGAVIMHFPGADTMLGFSIYCSFVTSVIALVSYYFLKSFMPGWMIFIGEFIAESICFSPRVILYNYLTYLFFTLGTVFLLLGIFAWKRQNLYLFIAGVCLGLNVMVRFPNIVETSLILVLWFYGYITRDKVQEILKKTGVCILGFLAGFAVPFIFTVVKYGAASYVSGIMGLFGMTEGASDYSSGGMIGLILEAYKTTLSNMAIMVPCVAAGIIMFLLVPEKYVMIKKILFIGGILILTKYYFATGVFTRNYYYYDSMFQAAMMFIISGIVLSVIGSLGILNGSRQEQTLAFTALMLILVTPIGSNNYTFPILNNLFIIGPIVLWLFRRMMQRAGEAHYNFAWEAMFTFVLIVLFIQGALFHLGYSFMDGADGTKRESLVSIEKAKNMVTTQYNADTLEELSVVLNENDLQNTKVILFGGIPGVSYLFDMYPAIDTTWPDLDSYSVDNFDKQLMDLSVSAEPTPTIIIGKDMAEYANIGMKYDILLDYIVNHDYNKVFEGDRFIVFAENR